MDISSEAMYRKDRLQPVYPKTIRQHGPDLLPGNYPVPGLAAWQRFVGIEVPQSFPRPISDEAHFAGDMETTRLRSGGSMVYNVSARRIRFG